MLGWADHTWMRYEIDSFAAMCDLDSVMLRVSGLDRPASSTSCITNTSTQLAIGAMRTGPWTYPRVHTMCPSIPESRLKPGLQRCRDLIGNNDRDVERVRNGSAIQHDKTIVLHEEGPGRHAMAWQTRRPSALESRSGAGEQVVALGEPSSLTRPLWP